MRSEPSLSVEAVTSYEAQPSLVGEVLSYAYVENGPLSIQSSPKQLKGSAANATLCQGPATGLV